MYVVGSIFRVVIYGTFAGVREFSNSFQFILTAGNTPFSFPQIIDEIREVATDVCTLLATRQCDVVSWTGFSVATLDDAAVSGRQNFIAPIPGALEEEPLPSQDTVQLAFPTGYSKRILKKAIIGQPKVGVQASDGQLSSGTIAAWATVATGLRQSFESTEAAWSWCYKTPNTALDPLIVFPGEGGVNPSICVQRRRRIT